MSGRQQASRRRLTMAHKDPEGGVFPCSVTALLTEDGDLKISVQAASEFRAGSRIGHSFETHEVPGKLRDQVQKALQAVLDEAHDDLKVALNRDVSMTLDHDEQGYILPTDFDQEKESIEDGMERAALSADARRLAEQAEKESDDE